MKIRAYHGNRINPKKSKYDPRVWGGFFLSLDDEFASTYAFYSLDVGTATMKRTARCPFDFREIVLFSDYVGWLFDIAPELNCDKFKEDAEIWHGAPEKGDSFEDLLESDYSLLVYKFFTESYRWIWKYYDGIFAEEDGRKTLILASPDQFIVEKSINGDEIEKRNLYRESVFNEIYERSARR
jgi:hypothetical protein